MIDLESDPHRKEAIKHLVQGESEFVIFLIKKDWSSIETIMSTEAAYNLVKSFMLTTEPSKN